MAEKPCCAAAAARKIRQVEINGIQVGISQLDEVLAEVDSLGLSDMEEVGNKLLKRIMVFNYVPPKLASSYRIALLKEYEKKMQTSKRSE